LLVSPHTLASKGAAKQPGDPLGGRCAAYACVVGGLGGRQVQLDRCLVQLLSLLRLWLRR